MYVRQTGSPLPAYPVWKLNKDQGDQWYPAYIPVPAFPSSSSYDVIIEGVMGQGQKGDLAIDDVLLSGGMCPQQGKINN